MTGPIHPLRAPWIAEARAMRADGVSLREVGACFSVSRERVRQVTNPLPPDVQREIYRRIHNKPRIATVDEIRQCAEAGMTAKEAAAKLGYSSVYGITWNARRNGFKFRKRPQYKHDIDKVIEMFMNGERVEAIAKATGYKNGASVRVALYLAGHTVRSRNEAWEKAEAE